MARTKKPIDLTPYVEQIIPSAFEDVMHNSMMPYAEHVILERALPRVEDGLKPVQRRILYTMMELGLSSDKPHRKCARIVGDCLGKYHPHGDSSVYDALVRLAQPFSLRATLVDGHGNFGSIDGDSAAAMRYTEARMTNLAAEMLRDIQKDTVPFRFNFDDTLKEPEVLPARYPNLLVNGSSGIAVGLATNIPTHNLKECIDATIHMIDDPDVTLDELMNVMPAPDFPTGGYLLKTPQIREAYETGRGKLTLRAKVHIEEAKGGKHLLCITEVPYQINKALMLERILKLSMEKKAQLGVISDIRDESDRTGMRAVIELKKDADPEKVLAFLYKYSDLQVTFGVNMVAIAEGKPVQLGLKAILRHYIEHQKVVVTRRTKFDLEHAKARAHILEGLITAVDCLDEVLQIIRSSKNGKEAKARLIERFGFSDIQAQAILDLRLQRLTGLEILELRQEFDSIQKLIHRLEGILKSEKKLMQVIKEELSEVASAFEDGRRTELIDDETDIESVVQESEAIVPEQTIVMLQRNGLLKRVSPRLFEKLEQPESAEDMPLYTFRTMTDHLLLFFTNQGNVFRLPVMQLEESMRPKDRGITLGGVLAGIQDDERIVAAFAVAENELEALPEFVLFTKDGLVKRTASEEYAIRRAKFAGIKLMDGDEVVSCVLAKPNADCYCLSKDGMLICFPFEDVPAMGRATKGVSAMKLSKEDTLLAAGFIQNTDHMVLFTERGYAKRMTGAMLDRQHRSGKGSRVFTFLKNGSNGTQIAAGCVLKAAQSFSVLQKQGELTPMTTDAIICQTAQDKGKPYVIAILDNTVSDLIV